MLQTLCFDGSLRESSLIRSDVWSERQAELLAKDSTSSCVVNGNSVTVKLLRVDPGQTKLLGLRTQAASILTLTVSAMEDGLLAGFLGSVGDRDRKSKTRCYP